MKRHQLEMLIIMESCTSLKEAADLLHKSPSTIGRSLKSLESELECCLFRYSKKSLVPSPEGKMILEYARSFISIANELDGFLSAAPSGNLCHNWSEREIHYLLTIRKHGNLSHAAEELFVSQPSLSQLLNTLDTVCSFPVFEPVWNGLALSMQGEQLFIYIEKMDTIFQAIHQELEDFHNLRRGTVKVGIPVSLGSSLIPLIVPDFLKRFPGIKLRILEANSQKLKYMLKEKQVDFCILHENTDKVGEKKEWHGDDAIDYFMYYHEPFYLVIPKKWKDQLSLPKDRPLAAADLLQLSDTPFVLVAKRQPLRDVIQRIFENVHILTGEAFNPTACCSAKNMETIKRLVLAETGITFLPASYFQLSSEKSDLISYPLAPDLEGTWTLAIALPQGASMSRSSREFIDVMKENVEQIYKQ